MDNLLRQAASIRDRGLMFRPLNPDRKAPTTATRGMGAIVARRMTDDGWTAQKEVLMLGPEDLCIRDMVATAADVPGREV